MQFFTSVLSALRRAVLFIVSGIMCISSFSVPVRVEPTNPNTETGNYFLPAYGETLISAHRLGKGNAPENTMMAIESCLDSTARVDTLEMDVQLTKDGRLVIFHDLYLDEKSDSLEVFGEENVEVFSKTYDELRQLNMGATFTYNGKTPYAGLRGDDIPNDLRIVAVEDALDFVETNAPGKFSYIIEVKYPYPWMSKMVDELYKILEERDLCDRVIIGSFWNDVSRYIDNHYAGKLLRSANPAEIIDFYGCFTRNEELNADDIKFMALQLPYYWKDDKLLLGNLGRTEFIDYAHKYGISVQYWTVDTEQNIRDLYIGGADMLMTNHPKRVEKVINEVNTERN